MKFLSFFKILESIESEELKSSILDALLSSDETMDANTLKNIIIDTIDETDDNESNNIKYQILNAITDLEKDNVESDKTKTKNDIFDALHGFNVDEYEEDYLEPEESEELDEYGTDEYETEEPDFDNSIQDFDDYQDRDNNENNQNKKDIDKDDLKNAIYDIVSKEVPDESEIMDASERIEDIEYDEEIDTEDKKIKTIIERIDDIVIKLIQKFQELMYTRGRDIYKEVINRPTTSIIEKYFNKLVTYALDSDDLIFTIFFKKDVFEEFEARVEDYVVFSDLENE